MKEFIFCLHHFFYQFVEPVVWILGCPSRHNVSWTYIRLSKDVLDVFWASHERSIYYLYPGEKLFEVTLTDCLLKSFSSWFHKLVMLRKLLIWLSILILISSRCQKDRAKYKQGNSIKWSPWKQMKCGYILCAMATQLRYCMHYFP